MVLLDWGQHVIVAAEFEIFLPFATRLKAEFPMRILATLVLVASLTRVAVAELQPDEVAVVAMKHSPQSVKLAKYYTEARQLPPGRICLIEAPIGETLSYEDWKRSVRPQIRRWIADHQLQSKLRCLMTVWDVPLKISKPKKRSAVTRARLAFLEGDRRQRMDQLRTLIQTVENVLGDPGIPKRTPKQSDTLQSLLREFEAAFKDARARGVPVKDTREGKIANVILSKVFVRGGGLSAMLRNYQSQQENDKTPNTKRLQQLATTAGQLAGLREGRQAMEETPPGVERDQKILAMTDKSDGLLGTLAWINAQLEILGKEESYASFDSELSLVLWPNYEVERWQPNFLHFRFDGSYIRESQKTLMVSRLEAPTFQLAQGLIDTAIEVEQRGLDGKVYLDARGLSKQGEQMPRGSAQDYDQSLINLEAILKMHTPQTVVLDQRDELFQPGNGQLAALYCGWYSLGNYVDAFEWQPGAVGYHLASAEAATLRDPQSRVWCKRMLEEGVCATIGPVHEPYLTAFPRPNEFFVLLLSGRYTLAECYYRTKHFNSWVMVLVGDPLYNPYRRNPEFTGKKLPGGVMRLLLGGEDLIE